MSTETKKRKQHVSLEGWLKQPEKKHKAAITFVECSKAGYPARTAINVQETDGTLLLAADSSTPGEKLTRKLCEEHKKPCMVIAISLDLKLDKTPKDVEEWINTKGIATLNIAGNCITRFPRRVLQADLNKLLTDLLTGLALVRIQSGGQTGIDEAGIMAGLALKVQTKVVAPKGWMFRGRDGKDTSSESLFKSRFT
jgi:hypothetical protein